MKKLTVLLTVLAFLAMGSIAQAASYYIVSSVKATSQTTSLYAGTAGTVSYTVTLAGTTTMPVNNLDTLKLSWTTTPTGVTTSGITTSATTASMTSSSKTVTLVCTTTTSTTAGAYIFTITSTQKTGPSTVTTLTVKDTLTIQSATPVELTSFSAAAAANVANLTWKTATEVNNYGFNIERRVIGSDAWSTLAFVKGNGTSNVEHTYTYADNSVTSGTYAYRLLQIDNDGTSKYSAETQVTVAGTANTLTLYRNYPNPFNPSTKLQFSVPENGNARLCVYNVLGQNVATLFEGSAVAGQTYSATFDGSRLASGMYFSVLEFNGHKLTQKMLMTK